MKNKRSIIVIVVLLLFIVGGVFGYMYYKSHKPVEEVPDNKPELVEAIDAYGYKLEDRDTELFKGIFEELKAVLSEEIIDYSKYAELLSKLYIVDVYTISNKLSKYDVGGGDYVNPEYRDNYELKLRDTLYKYVEDNSSNTRNQDLPEVASIEVISVDENSYSIGENKYSGYKVSLKWEYIKEEEYDKEATVYLIKEKDKLFVVEQKKA